MEYKLTLKSDFEINGTYGYEKIKFINCAPADADGNPYALESYAYSKSESDSKYALKSESGNVDLSGYYTKTECDDKFALKSESGNVDLSEYYTKTESDNRFALKSESSSIDWSKINEDSISMTCIEK